MSCTPRIQPLPASEIRIAGAPKIAIRNHGSAMSAISPPSAITARIGTAAACTTATTTVPSADRQPGGLHPLTDGRRAVAGPEEAGGPRRRPVGQEGQLGGQQRQDQPADGQTGQRDRAETAHDGEVEQQIERLGGEHPERGQRQPGDAAAGDRLSQCAR